MRGLLMFVLALFMAGCVAQTRRPSADAVAALDAPAIGKVVADYVGNVLPPATSTVWLSVVEDPKALPSPLRQSVVSALRDRGFAVAESADESTGAHALRFDAVPLDLDVLVRIELDQSLASRLLARDPSGALTPASPVSVRSMQ